jgi:hypothetical protein
MELWVILVADDHDALRRGLREDWRSRTRREASVERKRRHRTPATATRRRPGDLDGRRRTDVPRTNKALHPTTAVILMTAFDR